MHWHAVRDLQVEHDDTPLLLSRSGCLVQTVAVWIRALRRCPEDPTAALAVPADTGSQLKLQWARKVVESMVGDRGTTAQTIMGCTSEETEAGRQLIVDAAWQAKSTFAQAVVRKTECRCQFCQFPSCFALLCFAVIAFPSETHTLVFIQQQTSYRGMHNLHSALPHGRYQDTAQGRVRCPTKPTVCVRLGGLLVAWGGSVLGVPEVCQHVIVSVADIT
jgi:hypothetical protein